MTRLTCAALAGALLAASLPAFAQEGGIAVSDAYARSSGAAAKTAAAYMTLTNEGTEADTLLAVEGDIADRIEIHGTEVEDGVARMRRIEGGVEIAPGESVTLETGGTHVMFMGLTGPLEDGEAVDLTLVFETAGEMAVSVPVDLGRGMPSGGGDDGMDGGMEHGDMEDGGMNH